MKSLRMTIETKASEPYLPVYYVIFLFVFDLLWAIGIQKENWG